MNWKGSLEINRITTSLGILCASFEDNKENIVTNLVEEVNFYHLGL